MVPLVPLDGGLLPSGMRARMIEDINGLTMHVLEAGFEHPANPLVLLLHGFPELAYSWRKVMLPLAQAGFHVVAPDQRGYGRTTGWSDAYDQDLRPFSMLRLAADAVALVHATGHSHAAAVVGHDFGSPVAAWCALARPDIFHAVVLMSAPFGGAPAMAIGNADAQSAGLAHDTLDAALLALSLPRKHYQRYFATPAANSDMMHSPQGLPDFLRAYFHAKSADWAGNRPEPLADDTAAQLARMPAYYIMDAAKTMPESVDPMMPSVAEVAACQWLSDAELAVYAAEYKRTGFQGGLNWYRARFEPTLNTDFMLYANRRVTVPSMFIAGEKDWGVYQVPGSFERMRTHACSRMTGAHLVAHAGHWVMQEQPQNVSSLLLEFLQARV